jgi:hypothetical protein
MCLCVMSSTDVDLFTSCCNDHDICYATCGVSHAQCENALSNCMKVRKQQAKSHILTDPLLRVNRTLPCQYTCTICYTHQLHQRYLLTSTTQLLPQQQACTKEYAKGSQRSACVTESAVFTTGTTGFGCPIFRITQKDACLCDDEKPKHIKGKPAMSEL